MVQLTAAREANRAEQLNKKDLHGRNWKQRNFTDAKGCARFFLGVDFIHPP
jgi:hypothetical protein